MTCVSAECCGRRWYPYGDPPWSPGLPPHCATCWPVRSGQEQRGRRRGEEALTPASIPDRAPENETVSRAMFPLTRSRGHLWAHSPEPLRQPLLKRVHANADLRDAACQSFIDILPQPACPSSMPTPPPLAGPGRMDHRAERQHTAQGAGQGWRGARERVRGVRQRPARAP